MKSLKRVAKILSALVGMIAVLAIGLIAWLNFTTVFAADLPPLKDGDIIFQYSGSSQSLPILLASRSAYTHMGLIDVSSQGQPQVIEASSPVRATPLDQWISHGVGGRITIKRLQGLSSGDASAILGEAGKYLGLPYDLFFLDGRDAIYCSELIRIAYQDGAGIELGMMQKVGDLDIDYAPVRKLIEARWQKYPLCKDGQKDSFESCYRMILQQNLITPASIARDKRLQLIFTNFGAAAE